MNITNDLLLALIFTAISIVIGIGMAYAFSVTDEDRIKAYLAARGYHLIVAEPEWPFYRGHQPFKIRFKSSTGEIHSGRCVVVAYDDVFLSEIVFEQARK